MYATVVFVYVAGRTDKPLVSHCAPTVQMTLKFWRKTKIVFPTGEIWPERACVRTEWMRQELIIPNSRRGV